MSLYFPLYYQNLHSTQYCMHFQNVDNNTLSYQNSLFSLLAYKSDIQFIDCQQKSALFRCQCITILHEIFEVSGISSDECQLFTNRCSDLLSAALFCFCKCKIIFSCYPAVHAWSGKSICFAEVYDNHFQFFPCFIQQGKILWIDRLVLVTTS